MKGNTKLTSVFSIIFIFSSTPIVVDSFVSPSSLLVPALQRHLSIQQKHYYYNQKDYQQLRDKITMPSSSSSALFSHGQWYNNPSMDRDRSHVLSKEGSLDCATDVNSSKYILIDKKHGMYYQKKKKTDDTITTEEEDTMVEPLFLSYNDVTNLFGDDLIPDMINNKLQNERDLLAWVGAGTTGVSSSIGEIDSDNNNKINYWLLYLTSSSSSSNLLETLNSNNGNESNTIIHASPLREFGDLIDTSELAGLLATANGLIEFHKSHPYCQYCGSKTISTKAGGARVCTNTDCKRTTYPRIDVASIMLITSSCTNYALLGRKAMWPKGRYSTLAGFTEVGETIESSCIRETYEESGINVDPSSIQIICSQPWPFPKSLMVGFRGEAIDINNDEESSLPKITIDKNEMDDVQWFHKDYIKERLHRGMYSTLSFKPPDDEEDSFHIPGRASLARVLITQWTNEK